MQQYLNWNVKPGLKEGKKNHETHTNQSTQGLKQFNPQQCDCLTWKFDGQSSVKVPGFTA